MNPHIYCPGCSEYIDFYRDAERVRIQGKRLADLQPEEMANPTAIEFTCHHCTRRYTVTMPLEAFQGILMR